MTISRKDHQSHVTVSRHIHTPRGFPAYLDKKGSPRVPSSEERKLVCQIIHEAYEVSVNFLYMIVWSLNLPKKPGSLTRGGMPLWNTNSTTETSEIEGRSGHAPPVMNHLPLSKVACEFGLSITLSEIKWNSVQLRFTLPDNSPPQNFLLGSVGL